MIPREGLLEQVWTALGRSRIVAILGPRQAGKSTLARQVAEERESILFDLEDALAAGFRVFGCGTLQVVAMRVMAGW